MGLLQAGSRLETSILGQLLRLKQVALSSKREMEVWVCVWVVWTGWAGWHGGMVTGHLVSITRLLFAVSQERGVQD